MEPKTSHIFEFGAYRIDGSERQLRRNGEPVPLPPKVFDVLLTLVENHGHIVSKDDLMRKVWADTFVEDANLTVNISALRKVLAEGSSGSQFIETVPKHGYRFVADVLEMPAKEAGDATKHTSDKDAAESQSEDEVVPADAAAAPGKVANEASREQLARPPHISGAAGRQKRLASVVLLSMAVLGAAYFGWSRWADTRQPISGAASPIASIAVLPFENGVSDANAEYLSDGISESLIDRLSQLSGLRVASRSSAFRYKGTEQDTAKVGSELNVSAVLTGSVKQLGDELIIAVRLDDVRTNQHIWGEQYVRKFNDILSVQNEIAQDVTGNLRLKLTGADEQKLAKKYTQNTEAYQLYLKGNYEWNKHSQNDLQKAIEYYEQALEKDPNFALAYAGLSGSYGVLGNVYLPPNENFPKARAYAAKALALDDTVAHAHAAMGAVSLFYDWDWSQQEKEFKRAQELEPNYADAHQLYAEYLETAGRFDEARAEAKRAAEIDPLSAMFGTEVGFTYYYARQYDEAIAQFEKTLNLEPSYIDAYQYLGQAYEQKKMFPQAIAVFKKGLAEGDRSPILISSLGHALALSGDRSGAEKGLAELRGLSKQRYVSPYLFAVVYAGLSDNKEAFAWLEKALQDRASLLIWLNVEPQFDPVRADPRFHDLTARIGLNK